ncbi:MAG TPA: arsenite efflux transporter metallochaperone ArsD [Gemmatimonadaceae bacterium]
MARSLPLGNPAEAIPTSVDAARPAGALNGSVSIYDPAMCCPTGVCGPGVDPALLAITRDVRWLEKQGVAVERVGLAQEPGAFVANARVSGLMQAFGDGALPAVLVNGDVLCYGRYPSREEIVAALAAKAAESASTSSSCCTPGSGCC